MFAWEPALETGIAEIDEQHLLIFRKADVVLEAVATGRGAQEVGRTITFLADYAALHFQTEERFMRASGYPAAEEHAEQHRRIERRLAEVAVAYSEHGATERLVADVEALVWGWIALHIKEHDRRMARHLATRGGAG